MKLFIFFLTYYVFTVSIIMFCYVVFKIKDNLKINIKMKREHCNGCYNEGYNNGLGGSNECWSFKDAELVLRKEVHVDQNPPWNQEPLLFPNCYRKSRYVYVHPERTY